MARTQARPREDNDMDLCVEISLIAALRVWRGLTNGDKAIVPTIYQP